MGLLDFFTCYVIAIPLIYFAACTKRKHPQLYHQLITAQKKSIPVNKKTNKANVKYYKAAMCAAFLFFYVGIEVTYGSLVFTFAVTYKELCFSKSNAALLNAVYWGTFTFGRFVSIGVSMLKI